MADHGAAGAAQRGEAAGGASADGPTAGELSQLVAEVRQADRHVAAAVVLAGRLAGSGVAEREAGQPLELVLATACRLTGADRHVLVTAGEVLAHMPVLRAQFEAGWVSWGQVRAVTQRAKRLSARRLGQLDARLAATIDARGGLDRFAPDELVDAAIDAIRELSDLDRVERGEREAIADSFVAIQRDVFGGARTYGELDPQTAATILDALQAASPRPHTGTDTNSDGDTADDDGGSGWSPPARSRDHAQGLWRIAAEWLAGHPGTDATTGGDADSDGDAADAGDSNNDPAGDAGQRHDAGEGVGGEGRSVTGRRARPLVTVTVSLAHAQAAVAGTLDMAARGRLPRVTAATVEALACSGHVRAVVVDDARPLATSPAVTATRIPEATRRAVEARDRGCRWVGCDQPLAFTDLHHLTPQARGGTHDPANLVALCRSCHQRAHTHPWTLQLDRDSGTLSGWRHDRRRWHTLPPATPLTHPDDRDDGNSGEAPEDRDPPDDPDGRDPPNHSPDGRNPPDGDRVAHGPLFDHHSHPLPF